MRPTRCLVGCVILVSVLAWPILLAQTVGYPKK